LTRHIIIPDCHAHPDHDNERFTILGRFIADAKPDHVISMGDLGDFPSLSSYDKGKRSAEGQRYSRDLAAVHDGLERIRVPVVARKKKLPKFWFLVGNHEERITRAGNLDPALFGTISLRDLSLDQYGWETVDYNGASPGHLHLDGILYAHYLTSGTMGRPVSGINHASNLLSKKGVSCTVSHTHMLDYSTKVRADGARLHGLVCGCFFDYFHSYAGESNAQFWNGVVVKDDVKDGDYNASFIKYSTMKEAYR